MPGLDKFLSKAGSASSSSVLSSIFGPIGSFLDQVGNALMPVAQWQPGQLIDALLQQQIRLSYFTTQLRFHGYDLSKLTYSKLSEVVYRNNVLDFNPQTAINYNQDTGIIRSMTSSPDLGQIQELYLRNAISGDLADRWIQRLGFVEPETRVELLALANQIPNIGLLLEFATGNLYNSDLVATLGLQNEIPFNLQLWGRTQGFDSDTGVLRPPGIGATGNTITAGKANWIDLLWWNHWNLPDNSTLYELYRRLYGESPYGPAPWTNLVGSIDPTIISAIQSRNSVPAYFRDKLIAISYSPFNKREIQRLYNYGVVSDAEVYHTMRANGYSDPDSQAQLRLAKLLKREFDRKQKYKLSASQVCNLYQTGVLDSEAAAEKLYELEYDTGEASAILANCDLEWQKKLVDKSLRYIKDAFLYGIINKDQLLLEFVKLGIARTRMDQYIQLWELQRDSRFKEVRASEILKWAELGIITTDEAFSRLVTMGYPALDAQKMLIVVAVKLAEQQTKAFAAQTKAAERQLLNAQKAKEKEAKILATQEKNRIKALLVASSQANLKSWLKDGLITDQEATDRLVMKGWPNADIERFLEEAHKPPKAKGTSNATKTKKGKQATSGGSSSNPPTVP